MTKKLVLGIDTGGTHTDGVIYDPASRNILASAKAETTHHDLSLGISRVLIELGRLNWAGGLAAVDRIHLSTTLATNSIAEGLSTRVGLILIGYDEDQAAVRGLVERLPLVESVFVVGGHNFYGQEERPLDEAAVSEAAREISPTVSGWAVSSLFSVKNPEHELKASELIRSVSSHPVTLGRDLTGQLDAVRRAATAALNAGLVVIINRLLDAVKHSAEAAGLASARLMVVKGDGSLVSEDWARVKPIETVVSGPAASLVGARVLAHGFLSPAEKDLWVLDVGGTTTDMALVRDGFPAVNSNGAQVGPWETMTVAVATRTTGLGGDSLVRFDQDGLPLIGPRRVMPLCRLAREYPQILKTLQIQKYERKPASQAACFFLPGLPPEPGLNQDEQLIIEALAKETPLPLTRFSEEVFEAGRYFSGLEALHHPSIMISAFTPTDAMSILGLYKEGVREAAVGAAEMLGRRWRLSPGQLARRVLEEFGRRLAQEIISYGFERNGLPFNAAELAAEGLLGGALGRREQGTIEITVRSVNTIILLGAPANVFWPFIGQCLAGRLLVPPCFEAASAAGAAASPVYLSRQVEIHSLPAFAGYRLFLPDEIIDGETVDELAALAEKRMTEHMRGLGRLAGAVHPAITMVRDDRRLAMEDESHLNLGATLTFTVKNEADGCY